MRSAGKVKIEIMNYEIVLLLHQSVQETLMMGANSGRHQEEEMKVPTRKEKESLLRRSNPIQIYQQQQNDKIYSLKSKKNTGMPKSWA